MLPHGGKLIDRSLSFQEKQEILKNTHKFKTLTIDIEQVKDVKNIARGVYSPLIGFLKKDDFQKVVSNMHLSDGTVWPIPIVLDISKEDFQRIKKEKDVLLTDQDTKPIALLEDIEIYPYNKDFFTQGVFGTRDRNHPGVEEVYKMREFLIGGDIKLLDEDRWPFPEYNFSPKETREAFQKRRWKSVVAFQTRNAPHRGHEFLQKTALKEVDGLFIQPVIGKKRIDDFKDEYILISYEILINNYYPKNKTFLGILPLKMRYAGPREAVFHALIRKNFGCTHFIVGRDHAGIGNYYGPFDAQNIFNNFKKEKISINILKYPEVVYYPKKRIHTFIDQCPPAQRLFFNGTKIREQIKLRKNSPSYFIRPEVYSFLAQSRNAFVDDGYKKRAGQKGFVIWFTGLSQAGKTTLGNKVYEILREKGLKLERLDGDIVRRSLSSDLGFSKGDRDENIRRVTHVAKLLSTNGTKVICSFISPYIKTRDKIRKEVTNFIEIFCNCPLEVCERRDKKGLYQKARKGEIQNFTGISDPYEPPENPEIELHTDKETIEESTDKVITYLKERKSI